MPSAIRITGGVGPGWMLLGVFVAFLFAAWSYRWTRPPVSSTLRLLLALLRGFALAAVWLLATGFTVSWDRLEARRPRIAVLVDQSESMALTDGSGNRDQSLGKIVDKLEDKRLKKSREFAWFGFGERLNNINDSNKILTLKETVSDAEAAFLALASQPGGAYDAVLLISDGAFNRGGSAAASARKLHLPVFAVGIGDSLPARDVQVRNVVAPPDGYAGDSLQVDATIVINGFSGHEVHVRLLNEAGDILADRKIAVLGDRDVHTIPFEITPEKPGLQVWTVAVSNLEGEAEVGNNRRSVAVHVAGRKRRVALIAGRPDPEAAAWVQALERDPDTESTIVIGGGTSQRPVRGSWREIHPDSLDGAIVLLAGPYSADALAALQSLVEAQTPLCVITGASGYSQNALVALRPRLGRWSRVRAMDKVELAPERVHPIFTPAGRWFEGNLRPPPVQVPNIEFQDGLLLAEGSREGSTRRTVLDLTRAGPRTLVIAAEGVGQWNLALRPQDPDGRAFSGLTDRILRWLTLRTGNQRVHLNLARSLVTLGERTEALLTVQDEALRPIPGATVQATLTGEGEPQVVRFQENRPGRWTAEIRPSTPGRQQLRAVVDLPADGRETRTAELMVDPFRLERMESRMRPDRLREIAVSTGAVFAVADSVDNLIGALPAAKGVREVHGAWRPFGRALTLLLVVVVLALEWLVRTRTGMP